MALKKADPGRLAALEKLTGPKKGSADDEMQPPEELGEMGNEGSESAPPDMEPAAPAGADEGLDPCAGIESVLGMIDQALSGEQDPEGVTHLTEAKGHLAKAAEILNQFYADEAQEPPTAGDDDTAHGENEEHSAEM